MLNNGARTINVVGLFMLAFANYNPTAIHLHNSLHRLQITCSADSFNLRASGYS